jgi:hypothetical protein
MQPEYPAEYGCRNVPRKRFFAWDKMSNGRRQSDLYGSTYGRPVHMLFQGFAIKLNR